MGHFGSRQAAALLNRVFDLSGGPLNLSAVVDLAAQAWDVPLFERENAAPPEPPATFVVLNAVEAGRLARTPDSHLVRAVLFANAGVLDEAEQELNQLRRQNPESEPVRQLVAQLHRVRSDLRRKP